MTNTSGTSFRCLDLDRVEKAIELMRGEHDFASFCFGAKVGDDTLRTMEIGLTTPQVGILDNEVPKGFTIYHLHFKSRAFLYNQVSWSEPSPSLCV